MLIMARAGRRRGAPANGPGPDRWGHALASPTDRDGGGWFEASPILEEVEPEESGE